MRHSTGSNVLLTLVVASLVGCAPTASPSPSPSPSSAQPSVSQVPPSASATASPPPATPRPTGESDWDTARWIAAGDGARDMYEGMTVALPDGGALRIGITYQEDPSVNPMASQLWDTSVGTWRDASPLPKTRTDFAAVTLTDGRVLVAGGYNGVDASYSSAYFYDRSTNTWTKTGLMTQARTAPAAALLPDGRVLVAGGFFYAPESAFIGATVLAGRRSSGGERPRVGPFDDVDIPPQGRALATAEIFDPSTGEWSATRPMRYARAGAWAATLADGKVLVAGATDHNVKVDAAAFETAETFDPASGRFETAGTFPPIDRERVRELGVELPDDDGLPQNQYRRSTLVAIPGGDAVLIGHQRWWKHEAELIRSFRFAAGDPSWREIGDPFAWTGSGAPPSRTQTVSRLGAVVAPLYEASVLVTGGGMGGESGFHDGSRPPMTSLRYDPPVDAWSPLPDLPAELFDVEGVGLADGSVLLVGGSALRGSGDDLHLAWTGASYRMVLGAD